MFLQLDMLCFLETYVLEQQCKIAWSLKKRVNTELFQLPKTRFEKARSEDDLHAIKKETKWNCGLKETK